MQFSECLKSYMEQVDCTAAELADEAGIQRSSISRYLSGKRTPSHNSEAPAKLASGLASLAKKRNIDGFDAQAAQLQLAEAASGIADYGSFPERLREVLDAFNVAHNRLARAIDFDPSYISRILNGQRRPADLTRFIDGVASYIARNNNDPNSIVLISQLTGIPMENLTSQHSAAQAIRIYLGSGTDNGNANDQAMDNFLIRLDTFDLNAFMKDIKFEEMKIPTAPFQLPTTKTYEGIEEMKQAELDFLKSAVLSKSTDDIIYYSDMPLGEMAADADFPKKVMMGTAMLIRKGIHLHNIHNVHRPMKELIVGLEGWIPVYMTGQISPYYLPSATNQAFLHFLRSAGTVAASGEAIQGNQGGGRYIVTKNSSDVAYYRRRAADLLALANPLMRIYREEDASRLNTALEKLASKTTAKPMTIGEGSFDNMKITVWPKSHALIEKSNAPRISFLVEYPPLVEALEHYEPTLFAERATS